MKTKITFLILLFSLNISSCQQVRNMLVSQEEPTNNCPITDLDAETFLDNAGITDANMRCAVNVLTDDLKNSGLWSKMIAIYPFVGGTANSHKYNLKDPRDLDAAFRINYENTPSHSSNGVECLNGRLDTNIVPANDMILNDTSLSIYSLTDLNGAYADFISLPTLQVYTRLSNLFLSDMYNVNGADARETASNSNSQGFFTASRLPSVKHSLYKNGILLASNNTTDGSLGATNLFIGGRNINDSSERTYAFASIGTGLTDAEASTLYTIVQDFNTTLSRNVN